jgi:hypothetical protein
MRAIATSHFKSVLRTGRRAAGGCVAAGMLAVLLTASTDARAGTDGTTWVPGDALTQIATDALSQGVMAPGAWEPRVALVGLAAAGIHLGASTGPITRSEPSDAVRSAAYRLALPIAGAALGSLAACNGLCDGQNPAAEPLIGAVAGALVAHVLDPDTSPGREPRASGADSAGVAWTPMVAIGPGSCSIGVTGRF